jgi:hypothetical protein
MEPAGRCLTAILLPSPVPPRHAYATLLLSGASNRRSLGRRLVMRRRGLGRTSTTISSQRWRIWRPRPSRGVRSIQPPAARRVSGGKKRARGGTRTPTPFRAPDPKSGPSASSGTLAMQTCWSEYMPGQKSAPCPGPVPRSPGRGGIGPEALFGAVTRDHSLLLEASFTRRSHTRCRAVGRIEEKGMEVVAIGGTRWRRARGRWG